jgi:hypothetical protein
MLETLAKVRGKVEIKKLATVQPNGWNPNRMTDEMMASLEHGLRADGWIASQALLVWGKDESGHKRALIIDGEHRYRAALACGMTDGPMVVLDGLSETEAKALTVKLNQKRGEWDIDGIAALVRELQGSVDMPELDFGFSADELAQMFVFDAEVVEQFSDALLPAAQDGDAVRPTPSTISGANEAPQISNVRMVQLFLDDDTQPVFMQQIKTLSEAFGTKTVTDTVVECVRLAAENL